MMKGVEKEKEELKEKLQQEKETVKSKMAEIEVHKEWDKASVCFTFLYTDTSSCIYLCTLTRLCYHRRKTVR